jgi:hypothetical protein
MICVEKDKNMCLPGSTHFNGWVAGMCCEMCCSDTFMLILPNFILSYLRQLTLQIQLWNSNWPNMQHFLCCMTAVKLWARHQWRFDDIWPDPAVLFAVADV